MNNRFEWLKCKACNTILERMYSNEQLEDMFPVKEKIMMGNVEQDTYMKMFMFSKRLWICPNCGLKRELSFLEFVRISVDYLRGSVLIE